MHFNVKWYPFKTSPSTLIINDHLCACVYHCLYYDLIIIIDCAVDPVFFILFFLSQNSIGRCEGGGNVSSLVQFTGRVTFQILMLLCHGQACSLLMIVCTKNACNFAIWYQLRQFFNGHCIDSFAFYCLAIGPFLKSFISKLGSKSRPTDNFILRFFSEIAILINVVAVKLTRFL